MKKQLYGIKKTIQAKIEEKESLITNILKSVINEVDYKLDVKVVLSVDELKLTISSEKDSSKLKLDFNKVSDVVADITIPTFCNIASEVSIFKGKDTNSENKRVFDLLEVERGNFECKNEVLDFIESSVIHFVFEREKMESLFEDFIYKEGSFELTLSNLNISFEEAIRDKKIKLIYEDQIKNKKIVIENLKKKESNLIDSKVLDNGTKIEIRKNNIEKKSINIKVNGVLVGSDNKNRYIKWEKKPFKQDGYTFKTLIIDIMFSRESFNLNKQDVDLELFDEVEIMVKQLVEECKESFINPLINISYEEEKSLLDPIKQKLKYKKYTWLAQDIVKAVIRADDSGEPVLDIIRKYLPER